MQNTDHFQNFPKGADTMIIDSPFIQAEQSGDRSLPKMMISLKKFSRSEGVIKAIGHLNSI